MCFSANVVYLLYVVAGILFCATVLGRKFTVMNHISKFVKRSLIPFSIALLLPLFGLAGCGKGQEDGASSLPEWTYVPEFLELAGDENENISWYDAKLVGDTLCYTSYIWDEETYESTTILHWNSLTEGTTGEMPIKFEDGFNLNNWMMSNDGNICAVLNQWNYDEISGTSNSRYMLAKYDQSGNQLFMQDISGLLTGEYTYISGFAVDGQDRMYLFSDGQILLFDAQGNSGGTITTSGMNSYINSYGQGSDGKIYLVVTNYGEVGSSTVLSEVDYDSKSVSDGYANFPSGNGNSSITQDTDGNFLAYDSTSVYKYDKEKQEKEKLFDWLDSDINGSYVRSFGILSDGRVVAVYQDWETNDSGVALMTKTKTAELPQKQQIVIGTMYSGSDLQSAAVQFNKNSDTYHITIRQYMDYDNWSETSYTDAMTRMNNDITSNNCPDIIDLSTLNISQFVSKGVFEDMAPYLEQSAVLDRDNMIESVLDAYTFDGTLVAIPDSFSLQTVIGSAAQVGTEMGWTLEEMIAFSNEHSEAELFDRVSKTSILNTCLQYNMETFVDWSDGTCNFDSQEFKDLLEFVGHFPNWEDISWEEGDLSEPERIQNGEVLLTSAYIYDLDAIQLYVEMFQGDVTAIGYPNADGDSGCILSVNSCYGIATKSGVKDGAWAFIESYLTRGNSMYRFGFPNNREELDKMVEEAVNVKYITDENGEYILDENGNPIPEGGTHGVGYGNWFYDYRKPTREEVDMILELMQVAKPASGSNEQIMEIISEETEAFFQNQKSVDEVTSIIQRRVKVYVDENR